MSARPLVDVDASSAFAHPRPLVLALAFVAGLLDAVGYSQFSVFTANQAGNLVVGWTLLPEDPASALLSFSSIIGCGLGVVLVVVLRHVWPWLASATGSRVALGVAAALIAVAAVVGEILTGGVVSPTAGIWTSHWWAVAVSVLVSAAALGAMATVFVSGGGMRAPILASTNAYVDGVRYSTASNLGSGSRPEWGRLAWRAAGFPIAWTLGAAATVVIPVGHLLISIAAATGIVLVAIFARRVPEAADGRSRTV